MCINAGGNVSQQVLERIQDTKSGAVGLGIRCVGAFFEFLPFPVKFCSASISKTQVFVYAAGFGIKETYSLTSFYNIFVMEKDVRYRHFEDYEESGSGLEIMEDCELLDTGFPHTDERHKTSKIWIRIILAMLVLALYTAVVAAATWTKAAYAYKKDRRHGTRFLQCKYQIQSGRFRVLTSCSPSKRIYCLRTPRYGAMGRRTCPKILWRAQRRT